MKTTTQYTQLDQWIDAYLKDKELAWSQATLRSERHRLDGMRPALSGWDARTLWDSLKSHKPYTRCTMFSRASSFYEWLMEEKHLPPGPNPYNAFRKKNALQFKNTYQKRQPEISYQAAEALILTLADAPTREALLLLLKGGMRAAEIRAFDGTHTTGKGSKPRRVYLPEAARAHAQAAPSYHRLYRAAKSVGLKPHDLRKIHASKLVEEGANEFELTQMMGWTNLNTASSYVKARESRMEALARKVQGGTEEDVEYRKAAS